jgi:two-component system chemotaxis sensor kinase CheA
MQDQEMLNELIVESKEHLETIEPDLLTLEQQGENVGDDLVNRVFRAVHSIKGGFGFFGIDAVVKLSHAMENLMSRVRDKQLKVTPGAVDALLSGIDKLRVLLDDVSHCDTIPIADELAKLQPFISSQPVPVSTPATEQVQAPAKSGSRKTIPEEIFQKHADFGEEQINEAIKTGMLIYQITLSPAVIQLSGNNLYKSIFDSWEKFGVIISTIPDKQSLENRTEPYMEDISIIFRTVLEPDLIAEAIGIPQDHILTLDLSSYKKKAPVKSGDQLQIGNMASVQSASANTAGQQAGSKHDASVEDALRVKVSLLNKLMNFAGELVLGRNQLIQKLNTRLSDSAEIKKMTEDYSAMLRMTLQRACSDRGNFSVEREIDHLEKKLQSMFGVNLGDIKGLSGFVQNIDRVTTSLQESIMQTRLQPISVVFSKFPRLIRDLGKKLNKEINLIQSGQEVELDKSIIELLSDPLTHLIRNCADHGIEDTQARIAAGKNAAGEVQLRARQEGGKVIIEVIDDGKGIDTAKIKKKALEKGVLTKEKAASLSDREAMLLIFAPGFSTADTVSDVSGRGVGMDVVKTNIEHLSGTVEVDSEAGKGTTVTMKLPLTLAIIPSLVVSAGNRSFAVPQVGIEEVVRLRAKDISKSVERIADTEVLRLRGKLLPLIRLGNVVDTPAMYVVEPPDTLAENRRQRWSDRRGKPVESDEPENETADARNRRKQAQERRQSLSNALKIIVLKMESNRFGLVVDDIYDSEEIVVKPLPEYLKGSQCYSGTTIMGDGKVAMIIDPNGIAGMSGLVFDELEKELTAKQKESAAKKAAEMRNLLIFSIGGTENFAVNLGDINRIEKRDLKELERIGDKEFLKYEKTSLRLFRLEGLLPVSGDQSGQESIFIIVPKMTAKPLGIITSRVVDTIQTDLELDSESVKWNGVKGSVLINKQMILELDMPVLTGMME